MANGEKPDSGEAASGRGLASRSGLAERRAAIVVLSSLAGPVGPAGPVGLVADSPAVGPLPDHPGGR